MGEDSNLLRGLAMIRFDGENGERFYCIPGNFSDVETLANLAINSFLLKLQVANLVLHCNTSTSIKVCTMKNAKLAKIKRRNLLVFGKR